MLLNLNFSYERQRHGDIYEIYAHFLALRKIFYFIIG